MGNSSRVAGSVVNVGEEEDEEDKEEGRKEANGREKNEEVRRSSGGVGEEEEDEGGRVGRRRRRMGRTCSRSWAATSFFSLSLRSSPIFIIPTRLLSLRKKERTDTNN